MMAKKQHKISDYVSSNRDDAASVIIADTSNKFSPPPKLKVSQWADQYRMLSKESSSEPGNWRTSTAPYQAEIMDAVNDKRVEQVVVMTSAQVGKTEILNNIIGYYIHQDPAPMLLVQPTEKLAESWSTDRLAPMIRDSKVLRDLVESPKSRDSNNKILYKKFPGGHITMAGSNAPSSLASRPVRIVLCDEVDRYPASSGIEGDPVNLAKKRTTTFWNRKIILTSTPTIKDISRIEAAYLQSDQRRYYVPCPECGEYQLLVWAQVKWPQDASGAKPEEAYYVCQVNGCIIQDNAKSYMLTNGDWRASKEFSNVAGFHLNELYSPWVSWGRMASEFLQAKLLPETLKTWVNTALGETWEESGEIVDETELVKRQEDWGKVVPNDVLCITAGVDVQNDRLELEIVGWGRDYECWSLDYKIIYGDPAGEELWQELDGILSAPLKHASGTNMNIMASCVDSGGYHTQRVYSYCKTRQLKRIFAIKGSSAPHKPIVSKPSLAGNMKVKLFMLGTDTAKEMIYSNLKITTPGPGYCHFPKHYEADYFKQLTCEKIVTRYQRGYAFRRFEKPAGRRNEALDCRVYALAALQIINPNYNWLAKRLGYQQNRQNEQEVQQGAALELQGGSLRIQPLEEKTNTSKTFCLDKADPDRFFKLMLRERKRRNSYVHNW